MGNYEKRKVDLVVISDVHLGTYGCKATELLNYLHSIQPKTLILNGDIFDIWQFSTSYFPKSHMKILKYLTSSLSKGTEMYYITGNHDDMLRKFAGFELGKLVKITANSGKLIYFYIVSKAIPYYVTIAINGILVTILHLLFFDDLFFAHLFG